MSTELSPFGVLPEQLCQASFSKINVDGEVLFDPTNLVPESQINGGRLISAFAGSNIRLPGERFGLNDQQAVVDGLLNLPV